MADPEIERWQAFVNDARARGRFELESARVRETLASTLAGHKEAEVLRSMALSHRAQAFVEDALAELGEQKIRERQSLLST